ncbi:MAG: ABC transporter ATP-binding protein [Elusimicrobia bacterium]|nr:ABC transporter ATP-binding protein [Candidatus Obscuribacterium magneticum]
MNESLIHAEKLTKVYKLPAEEIQALLGIDLDIRAGEFISVMGPSGSGKTTLLDSLGCLTTISGGKLVVAGKDVSDGKESALLSVRRGLISFVFQDFLLISSLSTLENVLLPLYFAKRPADTGKARDLLLKVGLEHRLNHLPSQLSGGEKQRVAIARALVTSPKILFADEPTGNLDTKSSQEIFDLFKRVNKEEGLTIFVVTHNPALGSQASRTIRLQDGRITQDSRK